MAKIKLYLSIFFLAVIIPSSYLLYRSFNYLEKEALFSYREKAELISQIINKKVLSDIEAENRRSYAEYRFLMVTKVIGGEEIILSPLASLTNPPLLAGTVGYFQIDPDGTLYSPILPEGPLGSIELKDRDERRHIKNRLLEIIRPQDVLQYGLTQKITTRALELDPNKLNDADFGSDKHLEVLLDKRDSLKARYEASTAIQDFIFDVETDPTHGSDSNTSSENTQVSRNWQDVEVHPFGNTILPNHIVFHRNVFRGGQRFVQGFVVNTKQYFNEILNKEVQFSSLKSSYFVRLSHENNAIEIFGDWYSPRNTLYSQPLQAPFQNIQLDIGSNHTDSPPGTQILVLLGLAILFILLFGIFGIYRILKENFRITQKRSDFISAVSHELKTPLTAIRMYSEMLEEGFVNSEEKRMEYYRKISSESNRLSRLIKNILDLSRLERSNSESTLTPELVDKLILNYHDTFGPQIKEQGFKLKLNLAAPNSMHLLDRDGFSQILINIIENSMKFSKHSSIKIIEISTHSMGRYTELTLRDYGPGVPSSELQNIFDPFYRVEKEMVRQTSGTGIGLSLVKELSRAMKIRIEAKNANPGLQIQFIIPSAEI